MKPISADSATSSRTIRERLPPIARLMPISRVRSAIDIAIVLTTDRPPTTRLISAIPTRIELRIDVAAPICWSKSLPVIVATFGTWASIRSASTSGSTPGVGIDGHRRRRGRTRSSPAWTIGGSVCDEQLLRGRERDRCRLVGRGQRRLEDRRRPRRSTPWRAIVSPTCLSYLRAMSEPRTVTCRPSSAASGRGPGRSGAGTSRGPRRTRRPRPVIIGGTPMVIGRRLVVHQHHDGRHDDVDAVDGADAGRPSRATSAPPRSRPSSPERR